MFKKICCAAAALLITVGCTACSSNKIDCYSKNMEMGDVEADSNVYGWVDTCEAHPINNISNHLLVNRELDGDTDMMHHSLMLCRSDAQKHGEVKLELVEENRRGTDYYVIKIMLKEKNEEAKEKDIYYMDFDTPSDKPFIYDLFVNGEDAKELLNITDNKFSFKN